MAPRENTNPNDLANLESQEEKLRPTHPVDRGWAWMIMLAAFGVHFMSIGYQRSFGILFVEFQERYGSTSAMTSAINGCQMFSYCFLTLLVMNYVVNKVTVRTTCLIGCLLQTLGVASSSLIPNTFYLIVTQGILFGCGHALIYCPTLLILSQYFEKRRPIATTLATCGASLGGIAFPSATRTLLDSYGLQGGLLLLSGMLLQQVLFVLVYTPPHEYLSEDAQSECASEQDGTTDNRKPGQNAAPSMSDRVVPYIQICEDIAEEDEHAEDRDSGTKPLVPQTDLSNIGYLSKSHGHIASESRPPEVTVQLRAISKSHHVLPTYHCHRHHHHDHHHCLPSEPLTITEALSGSSIDQVHASMPSLLFNDIPTLNERYHPHQAQQQQKQQQQQQLPHHRSDDLTQHLQQTLDGPGELKSTLDDQHVTTETADNAGQDSALCQPPPTGFCTIPAIMKLPSFWVLSIFFVTGSIGTGVPVVFIPPLAIERGLTDENAAFFLMISSMIDMCGRLVPGLILHFNLLRPTTLIVFPMVCCGITYHLTTFFTSFQSVLALTLIYGLLSSSFWALQTLVVIEVMGLERLAPSMGYYSIFMGLASGVSFPIGGALRDITGSYSTTFHYFGACYLVAALAIVVLNTFMRKNKTQ